MAANTNVVRPEDVLPDEVNVGVMSGGVRVRKGTVGAFVANATNLADLEPGSSGYDLVVAQLRALMPALIAVGIFEVFELRSVELRKLLTDVQSPGTV
jgi:hypothetical protein